MSVDVDTDDGVKKLSLFEGDSIRLVASSFCKDNGLADELLEILVGHLAEALKPTSPSLESELL
jgi:hypothetical protein